MFNEMIAPYNDRTGGGEQDTKIPKANAAAEGNAAPAAAAAGTDGIDGGMETS